jgi:hypothetical protein
MYLVGISERENGKGVRKYLKTLPHNGDIDTINTQLVPT